MRVWCCDLPPAHSQQRCRSASDLWIIHVLISSQLLIMRVIPIIYSCVYNSQYHDPDLFLFVCFRFLPFVLLQHVEDTMVTSRLKWTVQTGDRATAAWTSSLAIRSGKVVVWNVFCRLSSFISVCIYQRYCVKQMPIMKSLTPPLIIFAHDPSFMIWCLQNTD